jgi:hypothetical protein
MDLGITGFHDLTSANEKYIVSEKQLKNKYTRVFKKHIKALNRLAANANLPETQELSPTSIAQILQERNPKQSILHNYCKINNSSFTGLLSRHTHEHIGSRRGAPKSRKHPNPTNIAHLHITPTTATRSKTPQAPHYKQLNQRPTIYTHRSINK